MKRVQLQLGRSNQIIENYNESVCWIWSEIGNALTIKQVVNNWGSFE